MRRDLESIERLCLQYGIQAGVHVHAGYCLSAEAMLVERIVADFDPAAIGIYADLGHMGLEGAYGGWVQSLDLISDRLIMLSLKNVGLFPFTGQDDEGPTLARSPGPGQCELWAIRCGRFLGE